MAVEDLVMLTVGAHNKISIVQPKSQHRLDSVVEVQKVELYASKNASNHRTEKYDLVGDNAVLRRSASFFLAVVTKGRPADLVNRSPKSRVLWNKKDSAGFREQSISCPT